MKTTISIRPQQIGDANRLLEILRNPKFTLFPDPPKTLKAEKDFIRKNIELSRRGERYNFTILMNGRVVGAMGMYILHRKHCAEAGYFVDADYWGRGIAGEALGYLEAFAFNDLGLVRLELNMITQNKASERVAIKCGYRKEGIARKKLPLGDRYADAYVYAKIRQDHE